MFLVVMFFLIASILGEEWGEGLRDSREALTFFFFPVCTVVGLGIAPPGILYLLHRYVARLGSDQGFVGI